MRSPRSTAKPQAGSWRPVRTSLGTFHVDIGDGITMPLFRMSKPLVPANSDEPSPASMTA